jgi:hypothetical protein
MESRGGVEKVDAGVRHLRASRTGASRERCSSERGTEP